MTHISNSKKWIAGACVALATALAVDSNRALAEKAKQGESNASAEQLMSRSHLARATWDNMPGFQADIVVSDDGRRIKGRATVDAAGDVQIDLPENAKIDWVDRKLKSLVAHRQGSGDQSYDVSFADQETTQPLGRLIRINDDKLMGSQYRIRDDVITEVHRKMGDMRFTISVIEVYRNPEGKYLPRTYTVSFWDAKTGNLKSTSTVLDEWKRVSKWDLPSRLLSIETADDGQRHVRQIEFRHLKLLANSPASK